MRVLNVDSLREGMIVGYAVNVEGKQLVERDTVLTNGIINRLKDELRGTGKVWVLDLAELKPLLFKNSRLTRHCIDFMISSFRRFFLTVVTNTEEVSELVSKMRQFFFTNRTLLYEAISLRDNHSYTYDHSMSVAMFSMLMGISMELDSNELQDLMLGCILHDYGKYNISNYILDKPDKLTPQEYKSIKQHPIYGVELTKSFSFVNDRVRDIILQHHEKLDGSGYPYGLSADKISFLAKIVTVADIFDAVTAKRSYHEQRSTFNGVGILNEEVDRGTISKDDVSILTSNLILIPANSIVVLDNGQTGLSLFDSKDDKPTVMSYDGDICDLEKDPSLKVVEVL